MFSVQILNWFFFLKFVFRWWPERFNIYNWSMSRSMYITYKHKLLQRKENQNYNPHCFHFQYCTFFLLLGTFHSLLVICQAWRPWMAKCQNSRTKMRRKKRPETANIICVSWAHSAGRFKFHWCKEKKQKWFTLTFVVDKKKHIIKTTSLIHIQPRSMQCQGFWFVTLWKAFSTNNVSYQYSIYALHKKTLPEF